MGRVCWGLGYREVLGWVGQRENSEDRVVKRGGEAFTDLVKNTYRVLLSRGMQGCYVHFMDAETQRYWESRMGVGTVRNKENQ